MAAGSRPFIEFTLDPSGFELADGTPKSLSYFDAPWGQDPDYYPIEQMPEYISSWAYVYHPDLIERIRDADPS